MTSQDNHDVTEIQDGQIHETFSQINAKDEKGLLVDHETSQDYGYEDHTPEPYASGSHSNRQAKRRNVVKANENVYDLSYHPGRMLVYSPPLQRQKWGQVQSLPHVDWGSHFFDLFYVAATYNVSYILVQDTSLEGLLYAGGTFWAVQLIWFRANRRPSRFVTEDDLFHRTLNIGNLVILGTIVLHIRPVKIMSNPSEEITMFVFCLCLVLEDCLELIKCMDEYFFGVGQRVPIRASACFEMLHVVFTLLFHIPALVIAAVDFFPRSSNYTRRLAGEDVIPHHEEAPNYEDENAHSSNYGNGNEKSTTNAPIMLVLAGSWMLLISSAIGIIFLFPKNGKHKEKTIPMNVGYFIHRIGDWIMLMLGESIFSLIIVDIPNETPAFRVTFYCGILTVVMLMYLHYESEPHDADTHAMRRSKDAGVVWNIVVHIYSFALISLGAAFTFFLTNFDNDQNYRRLAGGNDDGTDIETLRQKSANLFCISLAIIFACYDGMTALHIGYTAASKRLGSTERKTWIAVALRAAVIPFTATICLWETDPTHLSYIGLLIMVVQVLLRKLGIVCSNHDQVPNPDEAGREPEHVTTTPHNLRQSVLLASAWTNMTKEELEALGDEEISNNFGQSQEGTE